MWNRIMPYRPLGLGIIIAICGASLIGYTNPDGSLNFQVIALALLFVVFSYLVKDRDVKDGAA